MRARPFRPAVKGPGAVTIVAAGAEQSQRSMSCRSVSQQVDRHALGVVHNIKSSRQRAIRLELNDVAGVKAGEVEHERRVGADPGHAAVEASSAETLAEELDLDLSDGDIGQHGWHGLGLKTEAEGPR